MTEQQRSKTQPLAERGCYATRPLGQEVLDSSTLHPFKTYLEQQRLSLAAASQIAGVHVSLLWRVLQGLPISAITADKIRNGLRSAYRPYIGPIAIIEGLETTEKPISTSSTVERVHQVVVGNTAIIYEGTDPEAASQTFHAAMDTFTDLIEHRVEKASAPTKR